MKKKTGVRKTHKVKVSKQALRDFKEFGPEFVQAVKEALNQPLDDLIAKSTRVSPEEIEQLIADGVLRREDVYRDH